MINLHERILPTSAAAESERSSSKWKPILQYMTSIRSACNTQNWSVSPNHQCLLVSSQMAHPTEPPCVMSCQVGSQIVIIWMHYILNTTENVLSILDIYTSNPQGTHVWCHLIRLIIRNKNIYGLGVGFWTVPKILIIWTGGGGA